MAQEVVGQAYVKITTHGGSSTNLYLGTLWRLDKVHNLLPDIDEGYKSITISGKVRGWIEMTLHAEEIHARGLSSLEEVVIDGHDTTQYRIVSRIGRIDIKGDNVKRLSLPQSMIDLNTVSINSPSFKSFDIAKPSVIGYITIVRATNSIVIPKQIQNLHTLVFKDCDIEELIIESDRLGIWDARWGERLWITIRDSYIGELNAPDRIHDKISIDLFGPGSIRLRPEQYFGIADPILIKVVGEYTAIKWQKGADVEICFDLGDWRPIPVVDRCFMLTYRDPVYTNAFFRIKPVENNPVLIQADIIPEKQVE